MDKRYLIPIAIGVGVSLLVLIGAVLFLRGNVEEGLAISAAAAATAEGARRLRDVSRGELTEIAEDTRMSTESLKDMKNGLAADMEKSDRAVDASSLADLVNSENGREA